MSGLEPTGPAQPPKSEAYREAANPTTRNPAENAAASHGHGPYSTEARGVEPQHEDAVPQSLGRGVHGSGPTNPREARETHHVGDGSKQSFAQNENVDAEQLATYGEGKVADAVERKSGTQRVPGEKPGLDDFASDLDRKKNEQASARESIQEARKAGISVDGGSDKRSGVEVD